METNLTIIKDIAIIFGSIIASITLILAYIQYRRNVILQRAQQFAEMRKRIEISFTLNKLTELLEDDDASLKTVSWNEKIELLGFYEDVALMVNSGLMKKHVAHYMFSYYAIRCWESENFWQDLNRESYYWALFRDFVFEMKKLEESYVFKRKYYRV